MGTNESNSPREPIKSGCPFSFLSVSIFPPRVLWISSGIRALLISVLLCCVIIADQTLRFSTSNRFKEKLLLLFSRAYSDPLSSHLFDIIPCLQIGHSPPIHLLDPSYCFYEAGLWLPMACPSSCHRFSSGESLVYLRLWDFFRRFAFQQLFTL